MAEYQIVNNGVRKTLKVGFMIIPEDKKNPEWRKYQEWLKAGNKPDPAPELPKPPDK